MPPARAESSRRARVGHMTDPPTVIFNCTEQLPLSDANMLTYLRALEVPMTPGTSFNIETYHDLDETGRCPHCKLSAEELEMPIFYEGEE